MQRRANTFFFYPHSVLGCNSVAKERLARERVQIDLIEVLHDTGAFIRKGRPNNVVLGLMRVVIEKGERTKGSELGET